MFNGVNYDFVKGDWWNQPGVGELISLTSSKVEANFCKDRMGCDRNLSYKINSSSGKIVLEIFDLSDDLGTGYYLELSK